MKILFVDTPPFLEWDPHSRYTKGGRRYPSLSVTGEKTYNYLVLQTISVLREKYGYRDVGLVDAQVQGLTVDRLLEHLVERQPQIVVMYVEQIKSAVDMRIAAELKKRLDTFIVFTGPLVTALDKETLELCPAADVICRGEFDYLIGEIARCREQGKPLDGLQGITLRNGATIERQGEVCHIEDLDALPFPAYDCIDFNDYKESVFVALPTATMITSRGCPNQCIYCWFPQTLYSHKWRAQSPRRVVDEIEHLVRDFGVKEIRIDDDIFEVDRARVMAICNLIRERNIKVSFAPQCRADLLDEEMIVAMKTAGCDRVMIGNESGSQMILDKIRKRLSLDDTLRIVGLLKKHHIDVHTCFIIGFPWDTRVTIRQTIDFACRLNAEFCQITIATPLPGTEFYRYVKENGYLVTEDYSQYDGFKKAVVSYPQLPREEIAELEMDAYRRYFLRFGYAWLMFKRMFRSSAYFMQTLRLVRAFWRRKIAGWI